MNSLIEIDDTQLTNLLGMNVNITMKSGNKLSGNVYSFNRENNLMYCKYK